MSKSPPSLTYKPTKKGEDKKTEECETKSTTRIYQVKNKDDFFESHTAPRRLKKMFLFPSVSLRSRPGIESYVSRSKRWFEYCRMLNEQIFSRSDEE